jgi:hypothetical protein
MRARSLVGRDVAVQDASQARAFQTMTWWRHSRRIDPINRSAYACCHSERAVTTSSISIAVAVVAHA